MERYTVVGITVQSESSAMRAIAACNEEKALPKLLRMIKIVNHGETTASSSLLTKQVTKGGGVDDLFLSPPGGVQSKAKAEEQRSKTHRRGLHSLYPCYAVGSCELWRGTKSQSVSLDLSAASQLFTEDGMSM